MNIHVFFISFIYFVCTGVMKSPCIHVYRGCEENNPLWTTIRLYEVVNLEELLNVTKVSVTLKQNSEVFSR